MKQAIVTGVTGFIGSSFVKYLTDRGIQVLALGRKEPTEVSNSRLLKLKKAKYLKLDMDSISELPLYLSFVNWEIGGECVFFNLAWAGENRLSDLNIAAQMINVIHSVNALEVAKLIGCARFVQIGTMEEAFTEKYLSLDFHNHRFYNRHVIYSIAKMMAKQALEVKSLQLGFDFIYVLHSHVMGPDDDKDSFLQVTLLKLIRGEELIFSTGEQYFDVISSEDCCSGYFLIGKKGRAGKTYWVGSGEPRPLKYYVQIMYALFPSGIEMQFGKLPYNDIVLDKDVFSIAELQRDTGFLPSMTFEQTVKKLHRHLITKSLSNQIN
jgi:nucleoside-diphosphate-sugar epimerase